MRIEYYVRIKNLILSILFELKIILINFKKHRFSMLFNLSEMFFQVGKNK